MLFGKLFIYSAMYCFVLFSKGSPVSDPKLTELSDVNDSYVLTCDVARDLDTTAPASQGPTPCFPNKLLSGTEALNSKTGITDHFGTTSANLVSGWISIQWKSAQIKDRKIRTRTTQVGMGRILLTTSDFLVNVLVLFSLPLKYQLLIVQ